MADKIETFKRRIAELRRDLVAQGVVTREMTESAFDAIFARDLEEARRVISRDDEVDRVDLAIEQSAVDILADIARSECDLGSGPIREVLVCVKVNNELERIADAATTVAERIIELADRTTPFPETARVITNSVVGILRDAVVCFERFDAERAKVVLRCEGTVLKFAESTARAAEERVASGSMPAEVAFHLHAIVHQCEVIADHCTNIAEQVIYAATGVVVRHTGGAWVELPTSKPTLDGD
ncbi:MAG: PhoU domain-containing protein [Phycisphaerales bacterium]